MRTSLLPNLILYMILDILAVLRCLYNRIFGSNAYLYTSFGPEHGVTKCISLDSLKEKVLLARKYTKSSEHKACTLYNLFGIRANEYNILKGLSGPCSTADYHACQASAPALYQKSDLCIPRNETARPCSGFLHSCICERFILYIPRIGLPIWLQQNRQTDPGNI